MALGAPGPAAAGRWGMQWDLPREGPEPGQGDTAVPGAQLTHCASPQICNMMKTMMKSPLTCGKKPAGSLLGDLLKLAVLIPSTHLLWVLQVTSSLLPGTVWELQA